ncbi:hypothetical protein CPB86DRAFT_714671 [Serendipita vermifera]|nr:hypothetical protein CPB86DRAFT_714671 [Serendipita vermifera]
MTGPINPSAPESNDIVTQLGEDVDTIGNFRLTQKIKLNYTDVTITKWQSQQTGLRVVHVDYEGPIINGYFAVATEITDDSGCPHTLEHLIFHGSDQYPYSDALPRIVSRSFSSTPNAWTATDNTVYTLSTAGEASFLQLLPVFVDHILYPQLTENTFITEVHHIDKEGKDAGVVYSEMQGRQNTAPDLIDLAYRRKLYPEGSGYRSETGGMMEALRKLSLTEIQAYHSKYYAPHNLCLVITGRMSTHSLLQQVQDTIETRAIVHGQNKGPKPEDWKRPFMETDSALVPTIDKKTEISVQFPAKEEKYGEIRIVMVGPSPEDELTQYALSLLNEYLTGNIVAPLNKELVDILFPYCTSIDIGTLSRAKFRETHITMSDVPTAYLDGMEIKLRKTLRKIAKKGVNIERMRDIIDRNALGWKQSLEEQGGENFSGLMIDDFLYGDETGTHLVNQLRVPTLFAELRNWTSEEWVACLTKWIIEPEMLVVRGKPSSTMSKGLETEENKRVQEQVFQLGQEGLEQKGKILEEAKEANEQPMPDRIAEALTIPKVDTISWIPVQSASTIADQDAIEEGAEDSAELRGHLSHDNCTLPYALHFDHVKSQFVTVTVLLSTADVPVDLKVFIHILEYMFFTSTVTLEDGTKLSEDKLLHRLDKDLLSYSFDQHSTFPQLCYLSLTVEASKYELAITWLRRLLWSSKIDLSKLSNRVELIKQSLPETLRDPSTILDDLSTDILYDANHPDKSGTTDFFMKWLPGFERRIKKDMQGIAKDLESVRRILLDPSNLRISVYGDILSLDRPRSSWSDVFGPLESKPLGPVHFSHECLSELGKSPSKKAIIVSLANIESSYSAHIARGILGYSNEETPAILVAMGLLNGAELYFWKQIRGAGLAYGASASVDVQNGLTSFSAYRSPNAAKAYLEAKSVVEGLANGTVLFDTLKLEAAKSNYAYSMADSFSTRSSMVSSTLRELHDALLTILVGQLYVRESNPHGS